MNAKSCRICNNETGNEIIVAQERQLGLGDKFEYIECSNCKCIQLKDIPPNMERYYPPEYYAFDEPRFPSELNMLNSFLKKSLINYYMGYFDPAGFLLALIYDHPFPWIRKREISFNSKILDVGTGSGRKLLSLHRSGFRNLTGIDPYISADIEYDNGVKILRKDISEVGDMYDFITLHHSFEHMPDPAHIVKHLSRLLNPAGVVVIRIPVGDCHAWHKYREFWVGLDAPRHFFLHTAKSMEILLHGTDLRIDEIVFDSGPLQFTRSEKYMKGLTMSAPDDMFTKEELKRYQKEAKMLNLNKQGDMACFFLKKKSGQSNR
jgi:SAM-dependent methyltransferase